MVEVKKSGGMHLVRITGGLNIYGAATDRAALLAALDGATDVELDMTEVEEMDTAGYQLLLAMKREAGARGVRFGVAGHSRAAHDLLELYQALETLNVRMD